MSDTIIGIDIESVDPKIMDMGPGEIRRDGRILGVGIQRKGGPAYYRKPGGVLLRKELETDIPKVCHNASYDVPWIVAEGGTVNGKVHDTIITTALLDEHERSYSLDNMAQKYLGEHKGDDEIAAYATERGWKGAPQNHLEKMPRPLVAKYCKKDVDQTIRILDATLGEIEAQGLREIYEIEIGLFPLLWKMRRVGIRMDTAALGRLETDLVLNLAKTEKKVYSKYGNFNVKSGKQIAAILQQHGVKYPLTDKGNPKLGKGELSGLGEIGADILSVREYKTLLGNFVQGAFPKFLIDGRLHTQFLQTKRDEGGTVSGRFAARNPNLQQIPARHPIWGSRFRELFIPEEGMDLIALDYDGIESRIFAHYAVGGDSIRQSYIDNPDMDYHQAVADMAGIKRQHAKTINFAALYGAGVQKISSELGEGAIKGREILQRYHARFPAVKRTMHLVESIVKRRGYIETIGGRRARMTPQMAREGKYYLFLNRLIQGSAADLLKKGMLDAYRAGVFDVLVPHLLVHDEIVASKPRTKEGDEAAAALKNYMETAYDFKVPIKVSGGAGKDWNIAH